MSDKEKLIQIYNTLDKVETHGASTILMAACLNGLREMIEASYTPAVSTEQ